MQENIVANEESDEKSEYRAIIERWADNYEMINTTGQSNGVSRANVISKLEQRPGILTQEQISAIDEIRTMSPATGINTDRIRELAKLF